MKISTILDEYNNQGKTFYSFEYFPPKTDFGLDNLYSRIDRMAALRPAYIDITWGAGGSTAEKTFDMSKTIQKYFGLDVMMHLTCTNMPKDSIKQVLLDSKENNISNVLALRGDPPEGASRWEKNNSEFNNGIDLVQYIRKEFGDIFFIGVGGYPETHQEQKDPDLDISFLKQKVDAGADIIVTQLFYDVEKFLLFRDKCSKAGIRIPIVPGIMPIHNYARFLKFTQFCKVEIPSSVSQALESIKNDDSSVINYGIEQGSKMCEKLIDEGAPGLHFYTLNLEHSVSEILSSIGLVSKSESDRKLPWRQSTEGLRKSSEDVRPIFWSNRPVSYLTRTETWDDFPNGRWGDITSPTFGELNQYHAIRAGSQSDKVKARRRKLWGTPKSINEISEVFISFCKGSINSLPWCETPLAIESNKILNDLVSLNKAGYLTINSQPKVNGFPSEDPSFGWGAKGGRVFQKTYLEFFTSKDKLDRLIKILDQAVSANGDIISNLSEENVNAVTWGVFPGQEILQPTIVDTRSFLIWKDEAFGLWINDWASIYKQKSDSYNLLHQIHDSYYLVNIVDNDFIDGDMIKHILP